MKSLIVTRSFFALNRQEPFEPAPAGTSVIDPGQASLQADLAASGVTFEQFANDLVEQGLAQWSEDQ